MALNRESVEGTGPRLGPLMDVLRTEAQALRDQLVEERRHLHKWPELGTKEIKTQKFIMDALASIDGVDSIRKVAKTGVACIVKGTADGPKRTVLLRADIDALPMDDLKDADYASANKGVCHACGHDVHIAVMLGAVRLLAAHRDSFSGTALAVFQPAEEMSIGARSVLASGLVGRFQQMAGEDEEKAFDEKLRESSAVDDDTDDGDAQAELWPVGGGADASGSTHSTEEGDESDDEEWTMLPPAVGGVPEDRHLPGSTDIQRRHGWVFGRVVRPQIYAAIGLHVETARRVGYVAVKDGPMYAGCDDIKIVIKGRGGHAGTPHLAVNPLFAGANLLVSLNSWLSRSISPMAPCVLTFCRFVSGTTTNVIPEECVIEGTLRTHHSVLREELVERLPTEARLLAASFDAAAEVTIRRSFAPGANAKGATAAIRKTASQLLGDDHVIVCDQPAMGSEDFFEFGCQGRVPAAMFWLGGANPERGINADNHNAYFDIDEDCLPIGAAILAGSAIRILVRGIQR